MFRDKNLVPLSRQHQHALALCVCIDRASPIDESALDQWQVEVVRHFEAEIEIHFAAEEQIVFPAARQFGQLSSLVEDLLGEHHLLRADFQRAKTKQMTSKEVINFSRNLSEHIRKEERQLFEGLQELLSATEMERIGRELDHALQNAPQSCTIPSPKAKQ